MRPASSFRFYTLKLESANCHRLDYVFRFSVTKKSDQQRSYFWIVVDDERYALYSLYSAGSQPPGSLTITLELTAGQIVRVENDYSSIIYGTDSAGAIRSWFTGHLLYAL